jgi:replicative DNA helicase
MLLSTVMFNQISTRAEGLNRHKLMVGQFTADQKKQMKAAANWLKEQPGKVRFIEVEDYSDVAIKRLIAKYSRLGCGLMIVDTLKPMDETNDRAWAEFSAVAKSLFQCAKKYDVAVVATCQLSPEAMSRSYLDLTCVGKSKGLSETATAVTMFRPLTEKEKETIEPWNYDKNNSKIKVTTTLDKNKDYIMVFTPKNRFGSTDPQIIVERNMDFNTYKEIGYYQCSYTFDNGKR